ncbi:hypothetical protein M513_10756 [Trichuris suis]|uniref:Uncharacterized protein n=1 Tax=Trichuris suis TaxID=68888 RepID=A0A085LTP8_9BILA|nr:hypothetical protein M513_10756 [Trichuris suis]
MDNDGRISTYQDFDPCGISTLPDFNRAGLRPFGILTLTPFKHLENQSCSLTLFKRNENMAHQLFENLRSYQTKLGEKTVHENFVKLATVAAKGGSAETKEPEQHNSPIGVNREHFPVISMRSSQDKHDCCSAQ